MTENIYVAVIGAGPAGLFAAEKLAACGYGVALFNRDIEPGGMAEYGIYPDKHTLKDGLRRQFHNILLSERIHYFGNVCVGEDRCLTIPQLLGWGIPAVLIACGAQGTKWLGIPGEKLKGVYHAKDVVYHYNRLPPFSTMPITLGKRVVIVGAGNVMVDVARYLLDQDQVEEVHICVRRGPAEVKFTKKELGTIIHAFDLAALGAEIERIAPLMREIGQDPERRWSSSPRRLQKLRLLKIALKFSCTSWYRRPKLWADRMSVCKVCCSKITSLSASRKTPQRAGWAHVDARSGYGDFRDWRQGGKSTGFAGAKERLSPRARAPVSGQWRILRSRRPCEWKTMGWNISCRLVTGCQQWTGG